jgi:large subunit ribosomal protein L19
MQPGDTVRLHVRIVEGSRERVQVFQGVDLACAVGNSRRTFTVRRIASHGRCERTF